MLHCKRDLAAAVVRRIDGWDQHSAAVLIGGEQPRVSDLRLGRLERLSSIRRLIKFLLRLGEDVEIRVGAAAPTARPLRRGTLTVHDSAAT